MIFALAILFISTCFTAYVLHRRFDPIDENFIMEPPVLFDESDDEAESAYVIDDGAGSDHHRRKTYTVLVTGGTGVLGWRVAQFALQQFGEENTFVTIFDLQLPQKHRTLQHKNVSYIQGDLTSEVDVVCAFAKTFVNTNDTRIVFHIAGLLPSCSTSIESLNMVNANGAKTIVQFCQNYDVDVLIGTSSASVVLDRKNTNVDGDIGEDCAYPKNDSDFVDLYAQSKAKGEQIILDANGMRHGIPGDDDYLETRLSTCTLRPSIIYAADDQKFGERLLKCEINYIYGSGENVIDFVWCDNVAQGHIDACKYILKHEKSQRHESSVSGRAFHMSNFTRKDVKSTKEFYSLKQWSNPPPTSIPLLLMQLIALFNFFVYRVVGIAPIDHYLRPDSFNFMSGRKLPFGPVTF